MHHTVVDERTWVYHLAFGRRGNQQPPQIQNWWPLTHFAQTEETAAGRYHHIRKELEQQGEGATHWSDGRSAWIAKTAFSTKVRAVSLPTDVGSPRPRMLMQYLLANEPTAPIEWKRARSQTLSEFDQYNAAFSDELLETALDGDVETQERILNLRTQAARQVIDVLELDSDANWVISYPNEVECPHGIEVNWITLLGNVVMRPTRWTPL